MFARTNHFLPATLLLSALLAGCGGGDDNPAASGGELTISAATPAANNTKLDLSVATAKGNTARAADGFSTAAYCELYWENALAANGKKYALQVYFRQSDKAALNVSVIEVGSSWVVSDNQSGAALTGLTVDTAAKTIVFNNKAMTGSAGELGTLSGTVSFPGNATTAACGS